MIRSVDFQASIRPSSTKPRLSKRLETRSAE
ncbi:hypothetical protein ACVWWK_008075 [Bradyrhizobium sp. LB9.1b]